jgi:hypothetical protein
MVAISITFVNTVVQSSERFSDSVLHHHGSEPPSANHAPQIDGTRVAEHDRIRPTLEKEPLIQRR